MNARDDATTFLDLRWPSCWCPRASLPPRSLARGTLALGEVQVVVLDEADEMLDMGFADDIEAILEELPGQRQTVLFSATIAPRVERMTRSHLRDPVRIEIGRETAPPGKAPLVRQAAYVVARPYKAAALGRVHRIGRVGRAGRGGVAITLAQPREHGMLKAIKRPTRQRIVVEKLPTIADLRSRKLELTRAALHESIVEDDLERFRVVVEPLSEEFDLVEVALAAVKLAHEATGAAADEEEIPESRPATAGRRQRAERDGRRGRPPSDGVTRVFIGAGRIAGIRPQDVVGAIAGESRLSGREIAAIEIADRFTLVEVPDSAADEVIAALRGTTIRGKRPTVRRERYEPRAPRRS